MLFGRLKIKLLANIVPLFPFLAEEWKRTGKKDGTKMQLMEQ